MGKWKSEALIVDAARSPIGRRNGTLSGIRGDELDFKEGKELAREGAAGREFFVIITGTAEVTRGKKKLRTLSDGDFFGEISLVTKLPRTATVTTVSPTRALVITDRAFRRMLDQSPAIQRKVLEALGERLEPRP